VLAVLDISKKFHMFPAVPSERKYMGLVHPKTGEEFCYATCPMGTRNSPGALGRFGNAFIRMILEGCPLFHGQPQRNNFLCRLAGAAFNPDFGTGRIELSEDGTPVSQLWIHVDNILIHGMAKAKARGALDHIMAIALDLGLVCQPAKTSPPSHTQKFCGLLHLQDQRHPHL
jgi:hypothetical protein